MEFPRNSRSNSVISVDTVRTNYNDQPMPMQVHQPQMHRFGSTASLSSSVFSEFPNPSLSNYQFSNEFDTQLLAFYNEYISRPNLTPFDHSFPPSGILSVIAKAFVHYLKNVNGLVGGDSDAIGEIQVAIDIRPAVDEELKGASSHALLLTLIRMRLLKLLQPQDPDYNMFHMNNYGPSISRTNSISSSVGLDRVGGASLQFQNAFKQQQQQQQPSASFGYSSFIPMPRVGRNDSINSNTDAVNFNYARPPDVGVIGRHDSYSNLLPMENTYTPVLSSNEKLNKQNLKLPPLPAFHFNHSLNSPYEQSMPSPLGSFMDNMSRTPKTPKSAESFWSGGQGQQQQQQQQQQQPQHDETLNQTVVRKRESLNAKRNVH
ncbi:hypothetical protein DAMA08_000540 [Martiniozyma asiatica (nom. inval.)]|nr:hypothetical protein DAMA08_000540 [Martiniozyma asiatica]